VDEEENDYLWKRRHDALYRAELSAMYHRKREWFYARLDSVAKAIAIIGGSAALANLGGAELVKWTAAIITVTSTLSLVFDLSGKARLHGDLASRFINLLAQIHERGERSFGEDDVTRWIVTLCEAETAEPLTLSTLVILCQNQLAQAAGQLDKVIHLPWWRRITAHLIDYPAT
jgi:hypothetical protein